MQDSAADTHDLPVVIIGAGPVGLAAAAHVRERGLIPMVLEAGDSVAAAIRTWGHTRLFSPWRYNIDEAARRLLEAGGWQEPDLNVLPTGHELVDGYLVPLAEGLHDVIRTDSRVVAVSREGIDKTRSANRDATPLLVRIARPDGSHEDVHARSVIDASGTWSQPNPLGRSGLPAPGEHRAAAQGLIAQPLPAVNGTDRERFAGRHVLVVGAGHSAANTLLDLAELAEDVPETRISWAVRSADVSRTYGGEADDELAARGALGSRLRTLVESGAVDVHTSFVISGFEATGDRLRVLATGAAGPEDLTVDVLVPATGFRPDLSILSELRLETGSRSRGPATARAAHRPGVPFLRQRRTPRRTGPVPPRTGLLHRRDEELRQGADLPDGHRVRTGPLHRSGTGRRPRGCGRCAPGPSGDRRVQRRLRSFLRRV